MSPLANQNPLAQLNDIIAPTTASPWPPAPFYWGLLVALSIFIVAVVYLVKRIKKHRERQQQALLKLRQLQSEKADFILLNQLIKGVALNYFPRQQVASLHSDAWFDFLQRYSATPLFINKDVFLERLYQYSNSPCSAEDFIQVKSWIKQLPKQINKHTKEANSHV